MTNADWKQERTWDVNPSWIIQGMIFVLLAVAGYFIDDKLGIITDEMQFSRIERQQLRADMTALELGIRGDRFTATDWQREKDRLDQELESINERIRELEKTR